MPDSLISKTTDVKTTLYWQSETFKHTELILDTLHQTMQARKLSSVFLYGYFPKRVPEQDCNIFSGKVISYDLLDENGKKIQSNASQLSGIGESSRPGQQTRYFLQLNLINFNQAKTYKGFAEYEISGPADFNSVVITKTDTGKNIVINKQTYTVIAFYKNYIALKCEKPLKKIDFDFTGTNKLNEKYQQDDVSKIPRSSFLLSEATYNYYITHPDLTDKELDNYLSNYFNQLKNSSSSEETNIIILQDIGYIEKIFCYWPDQIITRRYKISIDLK